MQPYFFSQPNRTFGHFVIRFGYFVLQINVVIHQWFYHRTNHGNSEISANLKSNICFLKLFIAFDYIESSTKLDFFLRKRTVFFLRAPRQMLIWKTKGGYTRGLDWLQDKQIHRGDSLLKIRRRSKRRKKEKEGERKKHGSNPYRWCKKNQIYFISILYILSKSEVSTYLTVSVEKIYAYSWVA